MTLRLLSLCKQLLAVVALIACHGALLAEKPATVAEVLQKNHVGLSKPELLKALRNPDSHIRGLAAAQLAGDRAFDTIPQIAQALSVEPDGLVRLNIAQALAHMGDQRGIAALKEACASADKPSNKVTAAQYLLMLNDESCLEEIVEMIESKADSDQPQYAISVLPSFHNPPKELAYRIRQIMINALSDSSPTVRITAAIAIKQLHDGAFLPYLREAVKREGDDTVKGQLTEAVQTLETKREK